MGTSADDVRKNKHDLSKYFEYLTLLNPVRQGAENMLAHYEGVLRQCTNPTMTAKLQDLVSDIREIFRGDSRKTKGPEAFNLIKSELEVLERQLRDEEATQRQKAVKFNFAAEAGGSGETSGEHGSTMAEEDAAITIQRWWCGNRDQSLTSLCLAFQSVGLTAAWAKSVAFDELALCLQREDLLQVISMLLRRLTDGQAHVRRRRGLGDDSDDDPEADCGDEDDEDDEADELMDKLGDAHGGFMTVPSRVLLSAYVVCTHPEVVFAESNLRSGTRQEQNLRAAANMFVSALEMLCSVGGRLPVVALEV
jgi:hypothetical protein